MGDGRLCKGASLPRLAKPRRTAGKALVAVIREAFMHGVPTRSVDDLVTAMCAGGMSKSEVRSISPGSIRGLGIPTIFRRKAAVLAAMLTERRGSAR